MNARLHVIRLTGAASLQDAGRRGFLRYGLSASGPMDPLAHAAANRLVGNGPGAAASPRVWRGGHPPRRSRAAAFFPARAGSSWRVLLRPKLRRAALASALPGL